MYDEVMVNKNVNVAYLPTNEMTADVLSKPVCGALMTSLRLSGIDMCPEGKNLIV